MYARVQQYTCEESGRCFDATVYGWCDEEAADAYVNVTTVLWAGTETEAQLLALPPWIRRAQLARSSSRSSTMGAVASGQDGMINDNHSPLLVLHASTSGCRGSLGGFCGGGSSHRRLAPARPDWLRRFEAHLEQHRHQEPQRKSTSSEAVAGAVLADNSVAAGSILSVATEAEAETAEADAAEADTTYGELTTEGALRLVGALGLGPGDVVADLGSGRGSLAVLAALASGGKAVGIEIDAERHVTAARRWLGAGPGAGLGVGADVGLGFDQGQGLPPRRRLVASAKEVKVGVVVVGK